MRLLRPSAPPSTVQRSAVAAVRTGPALHNHCPWDRRGGDVPACIGEALGTSGVSKQVAAAASVLLLLPILAASRSAPKRPEPPRPHPVHGRRSGAGLKIYKYKVYIVYFILLRSGAGPGGYRGAAPGTSSSPRRLRGAGSCRRRLRPSSSQHLSVCLGPVGRRSAPLTRPPLSGRPPSSELRRSPPYLRGSSPRAGRSLAATGSASDPCRDGRRAVCLLAPQGCR